MQCVLCQFNESFPAVFFPFPIFHYLCLVLNYVLFLILYRYASSKERLPKRVHHGDRRAAYDRRRLYDSSPQRGLELPTGQEPRDL